MKKISVILYFVALCAVYVKAQSDWVSGSTYVVGTKVTKIINSITYTFRCEAAQGVNYSVDPATSGNYQWSVYYDGTNIQPVLVGNLYKQGAKVSEVLANGSTYNFDCLQDNVVDPKINTNGYAWAITNGYILPWVDYHYKTIGTKVTYNNQIYSLIKESVVGNSLPTNATYWKIDDEWSVTPIYNAGNKVWEKIGATVYYFTSIQQGVGNDPTQSSGYNYWTVSVDGGILPYNNILNYSIPGTKVTYNNVTYTLIKTASAVDIPGNAPNVWATDATLSSDCFRSLTCTSVVGFDGTDYNKSYQTGNTPVYTKISLKFYDNSNTTAQISNTLVNMGAERNPTAPLVLNGNDLLLRGSTDHYHGLGYYGSSGNVSDATTPQKRNFADTPIDGPVLYGWAGGALGIRQRQQIDNTTGISLEKIALRWDWANVYIGSTALPMNLNLTGSIIGNATFGTTTTTSKVTVYGTMGIGTTNVALLTQYKLAVNGGIVATSMDIQGTVPASDFVFERDYKLRSLSETEAFVNKNKHLPEVPSAEEFKKNGYSVGVMDDILLRKVEELTLYLIEMQKQNDVLKAKVEKLEKSIR